MKPPPYFEIIRWDITSFLTAHDRQTSRVYYGAVQPTFVQDMVLFIRAIFGGIARFGQTIFHSIARRANRSRGNLVRSPYVLLVTIGTPKYAFEEHQLVAASARKGHDVLIVYPSLGIKGSSSPHELTPMATVVRVRDYLYAMGQWLFQVILASKHLFAKDKKKRSLYVLSVFSIRQYFVDLAIARRIISIQGLPLAMMTLCPTALTSVVFGNYMRRLGVTTGGMRTQTTSMELEHQAINVDVLYCKSVRERNVYEQLLGSHGPRLENGCVLSLPEAYRLSPLDLPERYVLLLGTAPGADQSAEAYARYNNRLFRVGGVAELPMVFKGHNLAQDYDNLWFSNHPDINSRCLRVTDIRRNRELIERATLIVSAASTLLYFAILREKPIVIVETSLDTSISSEFSELFFSYIHWKDRLEDLHLDRTTLAKSSRNAKQWFDRQYFVDQGADYIIDHLLNLAGDAS